MDVPKTLPDQDTRVTATSHRLTVVALLLVLAVVVAIRVRLLSVPLERDEGGYAYAGQLMLDGIPPFAEAYSMHLPGLYAVYAAIMAAFGETATAIHLGLLGANALSVVLVYLLGRKLLNPAGAAFSAGAFALLSVGRSVQGVFANSEHFVVMFTLAGVLVLFCALERNRHAWFFVSGLLMGCGFIVKQHGMAFVAFGGLYALYELIHVQGRRGKSLLTPCAWYAVGSASPFGLTCLLLWLAGVFDTFWLWTFSYARQYATMVTFEQGIYLFGIRMKVILHDTWPFWILAALGFVACVRSHSLRATRIPMMLFLSFSFLAICPGLAFRPHYFLFLLPAIALLAGAAILPLFDYLGRQGRGPLADPLLAVLLIASAAMIFFIQRDYFFRKTPLEVSRYVYGENPFPESVEIARYIREHSAPDDVIAVMGSEPQIYFYSDRRAATGFIYTYALMERHPYTRQMQEQMIEQIEAAQPEYMIVVNVAKSWLRKEDSDTYILAWITRYVTEGYERVGVAEIGLRGPSRFVWGDDARTHVPQSRYAVDIYRKRPDE